MKKGFTLIELLVVLAIISVLASLLLPALSSAKARGHSIKCQSNLKQQQLALILYVHDNQRYPSFAFPPSPNYPLGQKWYSLLFPYTGGSWNNGVWACPTYKGFVFDGWSEGKLVYLSMGSYGYSSGIANNEGAYVLGLSGKFGSGMSVIQNTYVREDEVRNPTDMISLGDAYASEVGQSNYLTMGLEFLTRKLHSPDDWSLIRVGRKEAVSRHGGFLNTSFTDGHVEKNKIETLFFSKQEKDLRRWTTDNLDHSELYQ